MYFMTDILERIVVAQFYCKQKSQKLDKTKICDITQPRLFLYSIVIECIWFKYILYQGGVTNSNWVVAVTHASM